MSTNLSVCIQCFHFSTSSLVPTQSSNTVKSIHSVISSLQSQFVPPLISLSYLLSEEKEWRNGNDSMTKKVCCFCVDSPLCIISLWFPPGPLLSHYFPFSLLSFSSLLLSPSSFDSLAPFFLNSSQNNLICSFGKLALMLQRTNHSAWGNQPQLLSTQTLLLQKIVFSWKSMLTQKSCFAAYSFLLLSSFPLSLFVLFWKFTNTAKQHLWNACCWHGQNIPPLGNVVFIHRLISQDASGFCFYKSNALVPQKCKCWWWCT